MAFQLGRYGASWARAVAIYENRSTWETVNDHHARTRYFTNWLHARPDTEVIERAKRMHRVQLMLDSDPDAVWGSDEYGALAPGWALRIHRVPSGRAAVAIERAMERGTDRLWVARGTRGAQWLRVAWDAAARVPGIVSTTCAYRVAQCIAAEARGVVRKRQWDYDDRLEVVAVRALRVLRAFGSPFPGAGAFDGRGARILISPAALEPLELEPPVYGIAGASVDWEGGIG